MHPTLKIAINAAHQAGNIVMRYHNQVDRAEIVSGIDQMVERSIIEQIKKFFPKHAILSEQSGDILGDDECQWIIDPIDGSDNFLHGIAHYAVSIAMLEKGVITHGVIYDPFKDDLFVASRGEGAFLNEKRMRMELNKKDKTSNTLMATATPFTKPHHLDCHSNILKALHPLYSDIRQTGSYALDLAYLAAGRFDGVCYINLAQWHTVAGALLIQESGGFISDFSGGGTFLKTGNIVAGNTQTFPKLLKTIQPHLDKSFSS